MAQGVAKQGPRLWRGSDLGWPLWGPGVQAGRDVCTQEEFTHQTVNSRRGAETSGKQVWDGDCPHDPRGQGPKKGAQPGVHLGERNTVGPGTEVCLCAGEPLPGPAGAGAGGGWHLAGIRASSCQSLTLPPAPTNKWLRPSLTMFRGGKNKTSVASSQPRHRTKNQISSLYHEGPA